MRGLLAECTSCVRVYEQGKHTVFYRHELNGMARDVSLYVNSHQYLLLWIDFLRVPILLTNIGLLVTNLDDSSKYLPTPI